MKAVDVARQARRPGRRRSPTRRSRSRPTRSSGSPRRASAAPTCTSTRCSAPFMNEGDILGHEPMGIVEEVGAERHRTSSRATGSSSRSRSPAGTASCATSSSTRSARPRRCASRAWAPRCSATPSSTAQVPGGQAEYLRVPQAQYTHDQGARRPARRPLRLPLRRAADRVAGRRVRRRSPTAAPSSCSASARSATWPAASPHHRGHRVIGVDLVPERLDRARARGVEVARPTRARATTSATSIREMTDGRGPDSVIDAVGMEAHGSPVGKLAQQLVGLLPDAVAREADADGRRRPAERAATRRSTSSAAAARSRSSASTAARPTRCRC